MLGMESAAAGCDIPNDFLAGISHAIKIKSIGSLFVIVAAPETLCQTKRRLSTWLFFMLASKFITHPRVSQRNFSVTRFVQHKSTETKMKNNSLANTWGQADRPAIRQGKRNDKKRNGKERKKKMWVHHVCK